MSHYSHFTDEDTEARRGTGQSQRLIKGRGVRIQRQAAWLLTTAPHGLSPAIGRVPRNKKRKQTGPDITGRERVGGEGRSPLPSLPRSLGASVQPGMYERSEHFMKGHCPSWHCHRCSLPQAWQASPGSVPATRCSWRRSDELAPSCGGDLQGPGEGQRVGSPECAPADPGSTGLQELGSG